MSRVSIFLSLPLSENNANNVITREFLGNRGCFVVANWKLMGDTPETRAVSYGSVRCTLKLKETKNFGSRNVFVVKLRLRSKFFENELRNFSSATAIFANLDDKYRGIKEYQIVFGKKRRRKKKKRKEAVAILYKPTRTSNQISPDNNPIEIPIPLSGRLTTSSDTFIRISR